MAESHKFFGLNLSLRGHMTSAYDVSSPVSYTRAEILSIRGLKHNYSNATYHNTLNFVPAVKILRFRGSRAGSHCRKRRLTKYSYFSSKEVESLHSVIPDVVD